MSRMLDAQFSLLLGKERQFAEGVVYYMRAINYQPRWYNVPPINYVVEYLALKKETRKFLSNHLYLKQMSLSGAMLSVEKEDRRIGEKEMEARLRDFWLKPGKMHHRELYELLGSWLNVLFIHYHHLLQVPEYDYHSMIREIYESESKYENFLSRLADVEKQIDRKALEIWGLEHRTYFLRKQQAIQELRNQELRSVYQQAARAA